MNPLASLHVKKPFTACEKGRQFPFDLGKVVSFREIGGQNEKGGSINLYIPCGFDKLAWGIVKQ